MQDKYAFGFTILKIVDISKIERKNKSSKGAILINC